MSEPTAPVYQSAPPAYAPPAPVKGNAFGLTALVLGIVAVVFSIIPVVGFIAFVLGPLAVIFGIIGLTRKFAKKGTSVAGLVLGAVAVIIAIIVTAVVAAAASSVSDSLNKEHQIEYVVTTTGAAHVSYTAASGMSSEDITADWKKDVTAKGFDFSTLSVTGDISTPSTVTCEILVDGKSITKNSGTGTAAMASCSGSSSSSK